MNDRKVKIREIVDMLKRASNRELDVVREFVRALIRR